MGKQALKWLMMMPNYLVEITQVAFQPLTSYEVFIKLYLFNNELTDVEVHKSFIESRSREQHNFSGNGLILIDDTISFIPDFLIKREWTYFDTALSIFLLTSIVCWIGIKRKQRKKIDCKMDPINLYWPIKKECRNSFHHLLSKRENNNEELAR